MDNEEYLNIVLETNADVEPFTDLALGDREFLNMVTSMMIYDKRINVYYHSYHILKNVIMKEPNRVFPFWDELVLLLRHKNSYHRNYGMDLISSLAECVEESRFEEMMPKFYKMLNDEKISTRKYCITYSIKNIKYKPQYGDQIVDKIITSLGQQCENEKHRALLCKEFVHLLEETGYELDDKILGFLSEIKVELGVKTLTKVIDKLIIN